MSDALNYFAGAELPAQVFLDKYALRDRRENLLETTPDDMHRRLAREFARVEAKKFAKPYRESFLFECFRDFGVVVPQGSPMYGVGNDQYVTLSNCYVLDDPPDSYAGICRTDEQLVQISKRRGGVGLDLSHLRPSSAPTTNSARTSSGIVTFAERYSNSIREVGQNGRRGALMLSLSVHHPQVLDFARMKLDEASVTGANVSVRLTDEFLRAVEANADYEQRWPVEGTPQISRRVNAREVWNEIIRCAWARAEPGLLFWDRVLRESPADCYAEFKTTSTNPCSELPLCPLDSCRLLLLNLFPFVDYPFTHLAYFNFGRFYEYAVVAQRLMDDLVDLELEAVDRIIGKVRSDPESEALKARELELWQGIRRKCEQGRRTGTGVTALGDALAACGIPYGSDQSVFFTEMVYRTLKAGCYRSSVDMAREIGPFPAWDPALEKDCPFLLRIRDDYPAIYEDMQKYGRRNIALLTTAPAGSVSLLAGPRPYFGTTSGIEPLFDDEPYVRKKKVNPSDASARVDSVDQLGDRWQHFPVFHPKLRMWMDVTGETDLAKSPYHGCCAKDLDWKQRVKLQAAAQQHVDHAISSTLNLPAGATVEQVAEVYEAAWKAGCKGITVYRDGCRSGVLVKPAGIAKTQAPKRPKDLPCDVHHFKVRGEPFFVVVGLLGGEPFEVFGVENKAPLARSVKKGFVRKVRRGGYELWSEDGQENLAENVTALLNNEAQALTRMVSTALRHGADVSFVVHQLDKVGGDLTSLAKVLARALKKYVKDGTVVAGEACGQCRAEGSLARQEGCVRCRQCGWSKCA